MDSNSSQRDGSGRFRPGMSGNAGGRPRLPPEVRDSCREATLDVVAAWRKEVEERGPNWIHASKLLMAYGWGAPTATVEISRPEDRAPTINLRRLSSEELAEMREARQMGTSTIALPRALLVESH